MITKEMWQDIFIDNEQTKAYFDLCSVDSTEEGIEKHHILPKSIFPQYAKEKWNLVKLSYADHYKAHEILPFICISKPSHNKMMCAWNRIVNSRDGLQIDATRYAELRILHKAAISGANSKSFGVPRSEEHKKMLSRIRKGRKQNPESVAKGALKRTGLKHTEEWKTAMSARMKGRVMKDCDVAKLKLSKSKYTNITFDNKIYYKSISDAADTLGITRKAVFDRLKTGRGSMELSKLFTFESVPKYLACRIRNYVEVNLEYKPLPLYVKSGKRSSKRTIT